MIYSNLDDWLEALTNQTIQRTAFQALVHVKQVAERLGVYPFPIKVITIGGTNGKGSCVRLLEAIYMAAGYRVGTFTSPHLFRFNERIRIQQRSLSNQTILEAFQKIELARQNIPLNYFQFSLLAALLAFQSEPLDLAILEVGIGGRYDAVNIIDAEVAIIASVDLDHCEILGHTREMIAQDKAGIMRPHRPIICGDPSVPSTIFEEAQRVGSHLYCLNREYSYQENKNLWRWSHQEITLDQLPLPSLLLNNAATVLMAIHCLQTIWPVPIPAIHTALKEVFLPGRCQVIRYRDLSFLFDVSHNPAATKVLLDKVQSLSPPGKIYAIVGMLKNKDIANTLGNLYPAISAWFVTKFDDPRSAQTHQIEKILKELGQTPIECFTAPAQATTAILKVATPDDLIIVFGSFLTVSSVMKEIHYG